MTPKTKSIIIIMGTLIIGAIIGALATGAVFSQRVAEIKALRDENGLTRFLESVIEPTDDAQQAEIRAVLEKTASKQMEVRRSIVMEHRKIFEALREDLSQILTQEQKTELRQWMERDRRRRPGWPPPEFKRRPGETRFERMPFDSTGRRKPFPRRQFSPEDEVPADSS